MLPELCVVPHQIGNLAPDESLCAPAQYRVKVKRFLGSDAYLVRSVKTHEGDCGLYCARREGGRAAPLLHLVRGGDLDYADIADAIPLGDFERWLYFGKNGKFVESLDCWHAALRVDCKGDTFWLNRGMERFRFVWRGVHFKHRFDAHWRCTKSDAFIQSEVLEMLADRASDCWFAWNWANAPRREREKIAFPVARGSLDEVERLLQGAFWLGEEEALAPDCALVVAIGAGAGTEFYAGGAREIAQRSRLGTAASSAPLTARQTLLVEAVLRHFELWRSWDANHKTLIRELWIGGGCEWVISVPPTTAHQQLEGLMQLRDALGAILMPEEWETLTKPL